MLEAIITNYGIYTWYWMKKKRYTDIKLQLLLKKYHLTTVLYRNRLASGVGDKTTITYVKSDFQIMNLVFLTHSSGYCQVKFILSRKALFHRKFLSSFLLILTQI